MQHFIVIAQSVMYFWFGFSYIFHGYCTILFITSMLWCCCLATEMAACDSCP